MRNKRLDLRDSQMATEHWSILLKSAAPSEKTFYQRGFEHSKIETQMIKGELNYEMAQKL